MGSNQTILFRDGNKYLFKNGSTNEAFWKYNNNTTKCSYTIKTIDITECDTLFKFNPDRSLERIESKWKYSDLTPKRIKVIISNYPPCELVYNVLLTYEEYLPFCDDTLPIDRHEKF